MSDRELLERAAKAAGMVINEPIQAKRDACGAGDVGLWISMESTCWNPLTDDGDALRLAVKLHLLVMPYPEDKAVRVVLWGDGSSSQDFIEQFADDSYAATRRAIVRAAAAMVQP